MEFPPPFEVDPPPSSRPPSGLQIGINALAAQSNVTSTTQPAPPAPVVTNEEGEVGIIRRNYKKISSNINYQMILNIDALFQMQIST